MCALPGAPPPLFCQSSHASVCVRAQLPRLRTLFSGATELESTTLVVAAGQDVLLSQTSPAGTFDILPASFNHAMLLVIMVGLGCAVKVGWRMLEQKELKRRWK